MSMSTNNTNTITLSHIQDDGAIVLYLTHHDSADWRAVVWPNWLGYEYLPDGSSEPETRDLSDEAREFAKEIWDHLWVAEQSLWQQAGLECPVPYVAQEEVPSRRKIGSMGFKPWKAAYDAAIEANRQNAAHKAWCDAYEAEHWSQWKADVLAQYR